MWQAGSCAGLQATPAAKVAPLGLYAGESNETPERKACKECMVFRGVLAEIALGRKQRPKPLKGTPDPPSGPENCRNTA